MGQRSQIYIRWQKENGGYVLVARYFQWNFAERMISRTRSLIEMLKDNLQYSFLFNDYKPFERKIASYCDINFDFRDIVESQDIIKEYEEQGEGNAFKDYVFLIQDNNDGKLFIDVDVKKQVIKYCLTTCDMKLLDYRTYLDWDYEEWKHDLDSGSYSYTIDNLEYIEENAKLMSKAELKKFVDFPYNEQFKLPTF